MWRFRNTLLVGSARVAAKQHREIRNPRRRSAQRAARGLPPSVEMPRAPSLPQTESFVSPAATVAAPMVSVHEAVDVTRPCQLRHLWHSLWSRTPRASFRQTPEFLEASFTDKPNEPRSTRRPDSQLIADWQGPSNSNLRHRNSDNRLDHRWRFLIVSAWQRPIGIVPLREQTIRRAFGGSRVLSMAESLWGFCPGPVGPHPATTLTAAVRYLLEEDCSWDTLELPEITATGAEPTLVVQALDLHRVAVSRTERPLFGLELPATFGQFWADRDAAARQRWRDLETQRSRRRNEQFIRFRPAGVFHGDTDREWEFLEQLEQVVRLQDGSPHAARSRDLFERLRDTHAHAVDAGSADIALWLHDSRPAALAYNFYCRSRVETALLLADPNIPHATDRLIGLMLRDEIARGDSWHLFLPNSVQGTAMDHRLWRTTELREFAVTHDRRATIRSRLQRWLGRERRATSTSRC